MAGFLFNGCGVADRFKKIKSLGAHICPHCGKLQEFHLCEVKRKVHILYIPTFSYRNSYAVMCTHCDNGMYVSDEWAHTLLTGAAPGGVIFEGASPVIEAEAENTPAPEVNSDELICHQCGAVCKQEQAFCGKCGSRLSYDEECVA